MNDNEFQAAIDQLCEQYAETEPRWVERMRENPAVWLPHRPYGKFAAHVREGERPGCCEFSVAHPIHTLQRKTSVS